MAENQEKSKRFTFEGDTDDSHYFGVKRIEFTIWRSNVENQRLNDIFRDSCRSGLSFCLYLKQETIKLLPNAQIQLTIQFNSVMGQLEFLLRNVTNKELFNIEVGLRIESLNAFR
jgi:hypothetical protein